MRGPSPRMTTRSLYDGALLDGVDLRVNGVGADLLGIRRHHRIYQLLHLRAIGERDALQFAGLLQRLELAGILRRFDLPSIGARLLAGLEHRLLQIRRQLSERLAGEAD